MDETKQNEKDEIFENDQLDPSCITFIKKRLVRVEYPGEVRNIEKAIQTLGGIGSIENNVAEQNGRLELCFHPNSKYSKSCLAEKDLKPGILLKIDMQGLKDNGNSEGNYAVEGLSAVNFTFNKLSDFQYLPLKATDSEHKGSSTYCIYDQILPKDLPDPDWLTNDNSKNMEPFLTPVQFSHNDSPQMKLNVVDTEKEAKLKTMDIALRLNKKQQKNVKKIFGKTRTQSSIFVNFFNDKDIPSEPLEIALKAIKDRNLDEKVEKVKKLFEARPIWTKAAIRCNTGITDENCKLILPTVAYHYVNGPWRISWIKFGYDPRLTSNSRIYQTLDYRIRTADNAKLKVFSKRVAKKTIFSTPLCRKVSLNNDLPVKVAADLDERSYVLRPLKIPPARQMFYQICDIILPEVQEKISQLPKNIVSSCHPRNGWLPPNFIQTCRQIVNNYVLDAVQIELLQDNKLMLEKESKEKEKKKEQQTALDYCSQMLSNVRKGIYTNVALAPSTSIVNQLQDMELISLSSDDESQYTVDDIIGKSLPETMEEDAGEEEEISDAEISSDEGELDMEILQEINQMILQSGPPLNN